MIHQDKNALCKSLSNINKMDIVLIVFDANDKGDLNRRYYEAYLEKRTKSVKLIFVATKIKSKRVYS